MPERDPVDEIIAAWRAERADVDVTAMEPVIRLLRLARGMQTELDRVDGEHAIAPGWFDVLASLRRAGPPFERTPGALAAAMVLSSGGTTKRLIALEREGLVVRRPHDTDGRGVVVALTRAGRERIDAALEAHVGAQERMLGALDARERTALAGLLRRLLHDRDAGAAPGA